MLTADTANMDSLSVVDMTAADTVVINTVDVY